MSKRYSQPTGRTAPSNRLHAVLSAGLNKEMEDVRKDTSNMGQRREVTSTASTASTASTTSTALRGRNPRVIHLEPNKIEMFRRALDTAMNGEFTRNKKSQSNNLERRRQNILMGFQRSYDQALEDKQMTVDEATSLIKTSVGGIQETAKLLKSLDSGSPNEKDKALYEEIEELLRKLKHTKKALETMKEELEKAEEKLKTAEEELKTKNQKLISALSRVGTENYTIKLRQEVAELKEEKQQLDTKVAALQEEKQQLKTEVEELEEKNEQLTNDVNWYRKYFHGTIAALVGVLSVITWFMTTAGNQVLLDESDPSWSDWALNGAARLALAYADGYNE